MSLFGVFVETLEAVLPHPNADKLELGKLVGIGYQFVIEKGKYKPGDKVIYIPEDAICDEALLTKLNLVGKLAGAAKNRVKAIKLRGQVSQGIVASLNVLHEYGYHDPGEVNLTTGAKVNWADTLGVTKYDPEVQGGGGPNNPARTCSLPSGVHVYDLENSERYGDVVQQLLHSNVGVFVTEKLEGSHAILHSVVGEPLKVCTRRTTLESDESNWHTGIKNSRLEESLVKLREICKDKDATITLRGELIGPGVQSNIYGLSQHEVRIFDVQMNGQYVDSKLLFDVFVASGVFAKHQLVPLLFIGHLSEYLNGKSLREVSNGNTALTSKAVLREGIVVKPATEMSHPNLGRLVLKQRSPEYLAESKL